VVEKLTGPPGKVQKSLLDEEGRDFNEASNSLRGFSGSVQKVCANWKYGKDVSMGYAKKTIRASGDNIEAN
jgi:hypothetical protein